MEGVLLQATYYTYEWYRKDTGTVFYVGKGKGRRWQETKDRNPKFINYVKKYPCAVRKVHKNLTEEQAYAKEVELIALYRKQGQCECNFTDGGDAPPLHVGADAPNSRRVVQLGLSGEYIRTWDYLSEVEKELGLQNSRIVACCKGKYGKKSYGGYMWVYEEDYDPRKTYIYKKETNRRPILQYDFGGKFVKEWSSAKEASIALGLRRSSLCMCCKGAYKSCGGYIWRYKNGDKIDLVIDIEPPTKSPTPIVQLDLDGKYIQTFKDATAAIRSIGKPQKECAKILACCKGKRKTAYKYKWCYEYDYKESANK